MLAKNQTFEKQYYIPLKFFIVKNDTLMTHHVVPNQYGCISNVEYKKKIMFWGTKNALVIFSCNWGF